MSSSRNNARQDDLLCYAFNGLPDGYDISERDRALVHASGSSVAGGTVGAATYGEIASHGISTLSHALDLGPDSVFYDLGSGRGAAVLQVALQEEVRCAVGVELSHERHAIAAQALERLATLVPHVRERARFVRGNLATEGWYRDATSVFCTNLLFGRELDRRLSAQLARCETLRRVVTMRPLATGTAARLEQVCTMKLPFSWAEQCRVYVYERR